MSVTRIAGMLRCFVELSGSIGRPLGLTSLMLVAACSRPNPALLTPELEARLAGLSSPYSALADSGKEKDVSAGATDVMVLQQGDLLRARVRNEVRTYASIYWPKGATWVPTQFAHFQPPEIDCPARASDGEVCTLVFEPRPAAKPANSQGVHLQISAKDVQMLGAMDLNDEAQPEGKLTVRFDIDEGLEPFLRPPPDQQPLPPPGAPAPRIVAGDIDLPHLGKRSVVCRADASVGGATQRRNCTVEYGPVRMTVSRDLYLPAAQAAAVAFASPADDPQMVEGLKEAAPLLVAMARDPVLMRAFPPIRSGGDTGAQMMQQVTGGSVPTDDRAALRAQVAANAPLIPWHDVIDQKEFNVLCVDAAARHLPMLIYTADGTGAVQSYIYDDEFKKFVPHAMLVLVRMYPAAGDNDWAKAFAAGIGAGSWSALTATDTPKWKNSCRVGKVFQGNAQEMHPADVMRALVTGRPPPASSATAKPA